MPYEGFCTAGYSGFLEAQQGGRKRGASTTHPIALPEVESSRGERCSRSVILVVSAGLANFPVRLLNGKACPKKIACVNATSKPAACMKDVLQLTD